LPSIGKELHANAISLGWVISSFILTSAIFLLPFWAAWRYNRQEKGLYYWDFAVYLIDFSDIICSQHHLTHNLRIFQGFLQVQ